MQFIGADTDRICLNLGGIEAFAVTEGTIWGALVSYNALVRISMDTWKVQFVAQFPGEEPDAIRLFGGAVYYQGKVIFCPMRAKHIVVYDAAKNNFHSIPLDMDIVKGNKVYKEEYKTEDIVLYNDYAYIVGCSYPAIIRISLQDMSVKYITQPYKELDKRIMDYSSSYFGCVSQQGHFLYAGCCLSGDILKFSLEDETYEIIRTDFKGINAVTETKNTFLLASLADQKVYGKRSNDSCYRHIKELKNAWIIKMIHSRDLVYLFSFYSEKNELMFKYDCIGDKVEVVADIGEGFYNAVESETKIFATLLTSGKIIEVDMEKGTIEEHILIYSGTILHWLMNGKEIMVIEKEKDELKKYLEWLVQMDEI